VGPARPAMPRETHFSGEVDIAKRPRVLRAQAQKPVFFLTGLGHSVCDVKAIGWKKTLSLI